MASVELEIGGGDLSLDSVADAVTKKHHVKFTKDTSWRARVDKGAAYLDRLLTEGGTIYGVTTGYGDSCVTSIPAELVLELPNQLVQFHGVGMGEALSPEIGRAVLLARLSSLSRGYSGVRFEVLDLLAKLINEDIIPVIPPEGSVGASGDLTPLSYVAAVLLGQRDAFYKGERTSAAAALKSASLKAIELRPKEALAIMNGTAVMTGIGVLALRRGEYLSRLCTRIASMAVIALQGNPGHYDERLFALKPHPGQVEVAGWMRSDLAAMPAGNGRLQDRYSLRCAPHIIGVLNDALPWMRQSIERELNSSNDNPLIDGEAEAILHGGHFYGGHVGFVMDSLKNLVANLSDLMDRQLALLVDPKFNNGLPANLTGAEGDRANINHGFKAVQIATSAWAAEALKLTMPASAFSRSTECHNQDKVSMGTIAARDALRVIELTEQVAAALLLATTQAIRLRQRAGELDVSSLPGDVSATLKSVETDFSLLVDDRPLDSTLRLFVKHIGVQRWPLYH